MSKLTESAIEELAIKLLEQLGYRYVYAPDIAPDGDNPERSRYDEVILKDRLWRAVQRINPSVPRHALQEAVKDVERIHSPELLANNETFHRMLTEGVKVSYQKDGQDRGDLVWLIDFAKPENNEFVVANQFTVIDLSPHGETTKTSALILSCSSMVCRWWSSSLNMPPTKTPQLNPPTGK